MTNQIQILEAITTYLLTLNTGIPVIFATISMVAGLFKAITGSGSSLLECADIIERNISTNDTDIRAEIARLKASLGVQ